MINHSILFDLNNNRIRYALKTCVGSLTKINKTNTLIIGKLNHKIRFSISNTFSSKAIEEVEKKMEATDIERHFGGMAGNIAYGLSILGGNPIVISQVGKDFDFFYRPHLEKLGIILKLFIDSEKETACLYEILDEGSNIFLIKQDNSYRLFAEKNIDALMVNDDLNSINAVFVGTGKAEADIKFISHMVNQNDRIPIIYSPDSNIQELTRWRLTRIFDYVTILICTDEELKLIEERMNISKDEILISSNRLKYIITMIERSRIIITSKEVSIKVSEGPAEDILSNEYWQDAFRAGIIHGVSEKRPIEETAKLGSALASYAVESRENQKYSPSMEQIALRSFEVNTIRKPKII